ncbi:MAG: DUF2927 domain-containing protein [Pseudomonadota bacterium]
MSLAGFIGLRAAGGGLAALACLGCADYFDGNDWEGYEQTALVLGKMRLERAPEGMPVSNLALADNFRRIAFGLEAGVLAGRAAEGGASDGAGQQRRTPQDARPAATGGGGAAAAGRPATTIAPSDGEGRLRRWRRPVRWQITSLSKSAQGYVRAVDETARRIATATGHDIARVGPGEPANLAVLFLRPQDYAPAARALSGQPAGPWLAQQVDRFGRAGHTPCVGLFLHARRSAAMPGGQRVETDEILFGLALIRDGLPPRLARACVEEELAQAMGLPNDDPNVRPSVFNDDQEFALLTDHDEALLRILYDPRLAPGMTEDEAMAIVPRIIDDLDTDAINGRRRQRN